MSMGFKRPKVRHLTRRNQEWPPRLSNLCDRPTRQETDKSWPDECMTDEFFLSLPICPKCLKISNSPDTDGVRSWLITPALPNTEDTAPPTNVKLTLNSYLNYGEGLGV